MINKSNFISILILSLYLLLFIFVIFFYKVQDDKDIDLMKSEFYQNISMYKSFNESILDEYYEVYKDTNNIILSLNTINFPDYYNNEIKELNNLSFPIQLVNRKYYLTNSYLPSDLVEITNVKKIIRKNETMLLSNIVYTAYQNLYKDMKSNGLEVYIFSAYRSYEKQISIYNNSPNKSYVANPGHSEHQTGLVLDISTLNSGLTVHFENTNEFKFLKNNAHLYGFILRYPKDKEYITGYSYEPWHYRYVGIEHAKIIYDNNLTLEEYIYNYIPL